MKHVDLSNDRTLAAMAGFSALVFGAARAEFALQGLADVLDVPIVALVRFGSENGEAKVLTQNAGKLVDLKGWNPSDSVRHHYSVALSDGPNRDEIAVFSQSVPVGDTARAMLEALSPMLGHLWRNRIGRVEDALANGHTTPHTNTLHPSNPYGLTPAERQICQMISTGHRPASIAQVLQNSMPTVRGHLRQIYAKTGVRGLFELQVHLLGGNASDGDLKE